MAYFEHPVGYTPGSHQILGALVPAALGVLGAITGSKGKTQSSSPQYQMTQKLYEFAPEERAGVRSGMLGTLGDILGNSPGGAGFWGAGGPGGGGGGFFGGGGSAAQGSASLIDVNDPALMAQASLIDMNNPVFSLTAPKPWMSGMLSKGREYTQSATEDALRLQHDQALRAGVSTSSPAYMWMQAQQRRQQQQALANALRDANLAWTLPAAEGTRAALGQNAQLGTHVSETNAQTAAQTRMTNAQLATQASLANAAARTQASLANAQMRQAASQFGAQFTRQGYNDLWDMMKDVVTMGRGTEQYSSGSTQSSGGGLGGAIAGGLAGAFQGMNVMDMYNQRQGNPQQNSGYYSGPTNMGF